MGRLPNAPLQEVIFEVRWDLEFPDGANVPHDPKFEIGLGGLRKLTRDRFPEVVRKFHESLPIRSLPPYTASWQFRPEPGGWPLIQLGQGVLTVNDNDVAYDWDSIFFPLINDAMDWLEDAYEGAPAYRTAELRYIDSIRIQDHGFEDWETFVDANLNISIANNLHTKGQVVDLGLHQVIALEQGGELLVTVNSGKRDDDEVMIWQTAIHQTGPFEKASLLDWANKAHGISKTVFKDICKPHFYERFTRSRS